MCLYPVYVKGHYYACGKCIECLVNKSTEWAYRIMLEASLYDKNSLLTLTYNEDNCPQDSRLAKRDFQNFLKILRRHCEPEKIRYFGCVEHGSQKGRLHCHIIVFNYEPDDLEYFFTDKAGEKIYKSAFIEKLWKKGFITVTGLSLTSCKYVAKYLQKPFEEKYGKSILLMSRKPGIGYGAIDKKWLDSDKVYIDGKYTRIPRYFLKVFEREDYNFFGAVDRLKEKRKRNTLYFDKDGQGWTLNMEKEAVPRIKKFKRIFKSAFDKFFHRKNFYE